MNENQLIQNLKKLNQIKPRKEFIVSTKKEILGETPGFGLFTEALAEVKKRMKFSSPTELPKEARVKRRTKFSSPTVFKPVYAGLFCLFMIFGLFQFSQNALPGELLFQLRKITEKGKTMFASEEERLTRSLFLANERLMDLAIIAEEDQVQKLAPAVNEFKLETVEVAKNLANVTEVSEIEVVQIKQIKETKEKIEQVLATKIDTEEYDNALDFLAPIVEREILTFEENTLTEEEQEILKQIKEYFENGKYFEALIGILNLSQE